MTIAYLALFGFLIIAWALGRIWEAETEARSFDAHADQALTMVGDDQ